MRLLLAATVVAVSAAVVYASSSGDPDAALTNAFNAASYKSSPGCPAGQRRCGNACQNLRTSANHCGSCGRRCRGVGGQPGKCLNGHCYSDGYFTDFEAPTFVVGSINNQDGWKRLGAYDHEVAAQTAVPKSRFGEQSFRMSNAVTSGSFGDHTYAHPLTNSVGERNASTLTFAAGTRLRKFCMEFDVSSATPNTYQPDLRVDASPDRGDGARMSLVRFYDTPNGINVTFFDFRVDRTACRTLPATTECHDSGSFPELHVGLFPRLRPFTLKMVVNVKDGRFNDQVKVYVNGRLRVRGTTWEEYFRIEQPFPAENYASSRIIKTVLFRTGGPAHPELDNKGFLFDNLLIAAE